MGRHLATHKLQNNEPRVTTGQVVFVKQQMHELDEESAPIPKAKLGSDTWQLHFLGSVSLWLSLNFL